MIEKSDFSFSKLKTKKIAITTNAKTITFFPKLVELNNCYEKNNQRRHQSGSI
jgi:hypothetical protein